VRAENVRVRDLSREPDLLLETIEERRIRGQRFASQHLDRDQVLEIASQRRLAASEGEHHGAEEPGGVGK